MLTFLSGQNAQPVSVNVVGDTQQEFDETFTLTLSSPSGAAIADGVGIGTIVDDDAASLVNQSFYVTNGSVYASAVLGSTLYLGGIFTEVGARSGSAVPIDAGTGLPLTRPLVAGTVRAVVPDGTGGWFIGGTFTAVGGVPRANLARLLSDNSLSSWDPGA